MTTESKLMQQTKRSLLVQFNPPQTAYENLTKIRSIVRNHLIDMTERNYEAGKPLNVITSDELFLVEFLDVLADLAHKLCMLQAKGEDFNPGEFIPESELENIQPVR